MGGTVGKSLTLLELLGKLDGDIGLSELARAVDFDKATTLRLLTPLVARGMVEKLEPSHRYRIGPMVLHLARKREALAPFPQSARPVIEALCVAVQESCHLAEPGAGEMVLSIAVNCSRAIRVQLTAGLRVPFHCSASGLAYLAFSPQSVIAAALATPLPAMTPLSKTSLATIADEIALTRSRGYSINCGAFDVETCSVTAPILRSDGSACAALSIAAPANRAGAHELLLLAERVMSAAHTISKSFD